MSHVVVIILNFLLGYFLESRPKWAMPLLGILVILIIVGVQVTANNNGTSPGTELLQSFNIWMMIEAVVAYQLDAELYRRRSRNIRD